MPNLLKKKGVWLFVAAFSLFFGVAAYSQYRASKKPKLVDTVQRFDAQGIHAIRIERSDISQREFSRFQELVVKIQGPAGQVGATFDARTYSLKSRVEGDVLILTFGIPEGNADQKSHRGSSSNGEQILLPSSIQRLEFAGVGRLNVIGDSPTDIAALDVRITDCYVLANFAKMAVKKMTINKACKQPGLNEKNRSGGIDVGDSKIDELEITATDDVITLSKNMKVDVLRLNLQDAAWVEANAALLRKARFGAAPD